LAELRSGWIALRGRSDSVRARPHTPTDPDSIGNANRLSQPIAYVFAHFDGNVHPNSGAAHADGDHDPDGDSHGDPDPHGKLDTDPNGNGEAYLDYHRFSDGYRYSDGDRYSDSDGFTDFAVTNPDSNIPGHRDGDADEPDSNHASPNLDCDSRTDGADIMHG
jgi:hypothetical protein